MTESLPAETRLDRLLERLLASAAAALAAGDAEGARATIEEVQAVDPANPRAAALLAQLTLRHRLPSGERALMTLLFADLVDSTMYSERLEPEELRDVFALYRAEARAAVERYGGSVLKYMGDGILAAFGHPVPHEDDGRRAVLAGLDLVASMHSAAAEMRRTYGEAPQVRVGIHTGVVVIADLSDAHSTDERDSIVGVTPNLAARIQQVAEPGTVVISDVTRHLVETDFYLASRGEQRLKGISRAVEVFAVERPRHPGARFYAERYRHGGLVGRDEPIAALTAAWQDVRGSTGPPEQPAYLVVGEAGIGKTRLIAELVERVETNGGRVLGTGCLPYYSSVSLWPIGQLIERSLQMPTEDEDRLAALMSSLEDLGIDPREAVPFLGPLIGADDVERFPRPELDPAALLEETQRQLVDWLVTLAARTPHMLVVEDLHWADPTTIALVGRLIQRGAPSVLVVCTTRDASGLVWAEEIPTIRLGRLDGPSAAALVARLSSETAGPDLSEQQQWDIVRQAEGIPLFLEELTRTYVSEPGSGHVPLRLHELLAWRLKSPMVDQRAAQVAATVGLTFDADTVAAAYGDGGGLQRELETMVDAGIIEPDDRERGTYRFRHALMRDAAYETQLLDVRRSTHAQVARALMGRGEEAALVAQHLDLAGDPGPAAAEYVTAAQTEQARGAHAEATRLLTRAVDLLEGLPGSPDRDLAELTARMLHAFSVSSVQGYAAPEGQADHRRLEQLADRLGDRPEVLTALIAMWAYWFTKGDLAAARAVLDRLGAMVVTEDYAWFEPEVASYRGYQHFYEGHLDAALDQLTLAVAGFDARPPDQLVSPFWPMPNDPLTLAPAALACVHALRGELDQVEPWIQRGVERARAIGFPRGPFSEAFVKVYASWAHRFLRDIVGSTTLGGEVVSIGLEYGYTYWIMLGSCYLDSPIAGSGPDLDFLEQSLETLKAAGHGAFMASLLAYLATLYADAGNVDRAGELVDEGIDLVTRTGERVHLPELLRLRGDLAVQRRADHSAALLDYLEAIRVATEQGAHVSRLRACVALASLPGQARPVDWHELLGASAAVMPKAFADSDEAAAARALLRD